MCEKLCTQGYDTIVLDRGNNTTCSVHLFGATITSWKVEDEEQLFLSKEAVFNKRKAIRGGIPVVFPVFGPWCCGPQHGFARVSQWKVEQLPQKLPDTGDVEAIFALTESHTTKAMWNSNFQLTYRLLLRKNALHCNLTVKNTGTYEFEFNVLFHNYLKVDDVVSATIMGLKGCKFYDKTAEDPSSKETEEGDTLAVDKYTDKVFENTPVEHIIKVNDKRTVKLLKCNLPDTVVWNPWSEKAAEMEDFGDSEYTEMLCVEPGRVMEMIKLKTGESHQVAQILTRSCPC